MEHLYYSAVKISLFMTISSLRAVKEIVAQITIDPPPNNVVLEKKCTERIAHWDVLIYEDLLLL